MKALPVLVVRLMTTAILAVVASVLLASGAIAGQQTVPVAWRELALSFDTTLSRDGIVGGSVVLIEDGQVAQRRDYGFADERTGRKVNEDTIFHYGSITKTLNAIALMQLRDRGLLSLDEPLTKYVPELRQVHNPFGPMDAITVRMALNHTAGFQGPTWPYRRGEKWEPFEPTRWEQLVSMMPYEQILFAPGSRYGYSNPAWIYLARAEEALSGDTWQYHVQKNIFTPLGLERSYFGLTPYHLKAHRSSHYVIRRDATGKLQRDDYDGDFDPGITIPNGGWNAPLADLVEYVAFLTRATRGDSARARLYDGILSRHTLEEMWQAGPVTSDEGTERMGLGFFIIDRCGQRLVGHTGSQGGFAALMYMNPTTRRAVVAAFNTINLTEQRQAFSTIRDQAQRSLCPGNHVAVPAGT